MTRYVTDTHALLWYLYQDPKLSHSARLVFEKADRGEAEIMIPTISLVEIIYLSEKSRIPTEAVEKIFVLLTSDAENYRLASLDMHVVQTIPLVDRSIVPELPDRVIAATALSMGARLISRDTNLNRLSNLAIVWE